MSNDWLCRVRYDSDRNKTHRTEYWNTRRDNNKWNLLSIVENLHYNSTIYEYKLRVISETVWMNARK